MGDTLAITLNYGLTHPARYAAPQIIQSSNSDIYLTFNKSLYWPGDTVYADINMGSSTNVQSNFYGAAFTLNYDNTKIKFGSEQFYYNNSWVGNINQSKIKLAKIFPSSGKVDASLVRTTKTDTNGFGKVATFRMILRDTLYANQLYFTITNSTKTDYNGIYSSMNTGTDSVALFQGIGIDKNEINNQISIFPIPATNLLTIQSASALGEMIIYDVLGNEVLRTSHLAPRTSVDISQLPAGLYTLQTKTWHAKFVKQ